MRFVDMQDVDFKTELHWLGNRSHPCARLLVTAKGRGQTAELMAIFQGKNALHKYTWEVWFDSGSRLHGSYAEFHEAYTAATSYLLRRGREAADSAKADAVFVAAQRQHLPGDD